MTKKKGEMTEEQKEAYQRRDLNFIQNIKDTRGVDEIEARKIFNRYLQSSSKSRMKLRNEVRKHLREHKSPPSHSTPIETDKVHVRQPVKKGKEKRQSAKTVKEAVTKSKSKTVPIRLTNAAKKYPNASLYELRYGVNSKASQNYRLKNGQGRFYEK